MTCPYITRTWFGTQLNLRINNQPITNFVDWLTHSILHQKEETIIQIAALIYNIWFARNQSIYEEKFIPEIDIIQRSERSIYEFVKANTRFDFDNQHRHLSACPPKLPNRSKWKKPEEGLLKANCDSNLQVKGWWGLSSIIRNNNGLVMASAAWKVKGSEEVILAEAFSLFIHGSFSHRLWFQTMRRFLGF